MPTQLFQCHEPGSFMQAVKKKAEGKESLCYDASGLNILVWLTLLPQKFFLR